VAGKPCHGYAATFKSCFEYPRHLSSVTNISPMLRSSDTTVFGVTTNSVNNFAQYFSTRPIHDLRGEAKEALLASNFDQAVCFAVTSLRHLRQEREGKIFMPHSPLYSLEQYIKAIAALATRMADADTGAVKSALLCCELFISIEVVQKNYFSAAQHFLYGLRIMKEYATRPSIDQSGNLSPTKNFDMPQIDVFILKLFAPHPEPLTEDAKRELDLESYSFIMLIRSARAQLEQVAELIFDLVQRITTLSTSNEGFNLLEEKKWILTLLQDWYADIQMRITGMGTEKQATTSVDACYLFLFYSTLQVSASMLLSPSSVDAGVEEFAMLGFARLLTEARGQAR
jgi:hypothetical protein